jgi:hypothetical protein
MRDLKIKELNEVRDFIGPQLRIDRIKLRIKIVYLNGRAPKLKSIVY